ncbi:MAG: F0F1 ATP synthase subunit delta [Planctomycetota bacterium]|jgi:F-type H+-transporting ATPase subunit delta
MRPAVVGRYARALISAADARGRAGQAARSLARAAEFFATADGAQAAALLQSSRVPAPERESLLEEVASALDLEDEAKALVSEFVRARALRRLPAVAERARRLACEAGGTFDAELSTAAPVRQEVVDRIRAAAERLLGRPVDLAVKEDPGLRAGVVLRAGNRIWDGSLAGRMSRAGEGLAR